MSLKAFLSEYHEIASRLGIPSNLHTTAQHDGSPHVEFQSGLFHFVVTERGSEFERRTTASHEEAMYWFVRELTSRKASNFELKNRVKNQDFRRIYFQKNIEILNSINPVWAKWQQLEDEQTLSKHPFDDLSDQRGAYCVSLQDSGMESHKAWSLALEKYPEPQAQS